MGEEFIVVMELIMVEEFFDIFFFGVFKVFKVVLEVFKVFWYVFVIIIRFVILVEWDCN